MAQAKVEIKPEFKEITKKNTSAESQFLKVRDYNFFRVNTPQGQDFCFAAEIVNESVQAFYGCFLVVNNAFKIPLPYIMPGTTVPVAFDSRDLDTEFGPANAQVVRSAISSIADKSQINLMIEASTECYEFPFTANLELEVKASDAATRTLTYTIKNGNQQEINGGLLDLVFYNQGQLVAGLRTPIEKMLPGRTHYVNVFIPTDLKFTEVVPNLVMPKSDNLTFLGYIKELKHQEQVINDSPDMPFEEKKTFEDQTEVLKTMADEAAKLVRTTEKTHVHHTPFILMQNIGIALINIFPATWHLVYDFWDNTLDHFPPAFYIVPWLALTAASWIFEWDINARICISAAPLLFVGAIIAIAGIPNYIWHLCKKTRFHAFDAKKTEEEKAKLLEEAKKTAAEAEKMYKEYNPKEVEDTINQYNALVDQMNEKITEYNDEMKKTRAQASERINQIKTNFPQYTQVLETMKDDEMNMTLNSTDYKRYDDAEIFAEIDKIQSARAEEERREEEEARNQRIINEVKRQGDMTREHQSDVEAAYEAKLNAVQADTEMQISAVRSEAAANAAAASRAASEAAAAGAKRVARAVKDAAAQASVDSTIRNGYLASINGYARGIYYNNW